MESWAGFIWAETYVGPTGKLQVKVVTVEEPLEPHQQALTSHLVLNRAIASERFLFMHRVRMLGVPERARKRCCNFNCAAILA